MDSSPSEFCPAADHRLRASDNRTQTLQLLQDVRYVNDACIHRVSVLSLRCREDRTLAKAALATSGRTGSVQMFSEGLTEIFSFTLYKDHLRIHEIISG